MQTRVMALTLAALLAAPLVMAQTSVPKVRATIPFAFTAGGKTIPAGECTFSHLYGTGAGSPLWMVEDQEGRGQSFFITQAAYKQPNTRPSVVFNCYGSRCFLSSIWLSGELGVYIPPTKAERNLMVAGVKPEQTVLFAQLR